MTKKEVLAHLNRAERFIRERNSSKALQEIALAKEGVAGLREPDAIEPPPAPGWKTVFEDEFGHGTSDGLGGFVLGFDNDTKPTTSLDGICTFTLAANQDRSELSVNNGSNAQKWTEGERLLIRETFIVPAGFIYGGPGKHCTIQQFRQNTSAGSPLLSLELGDYGKGKGLYLHDKTAGDEYRFAFAAIGFEGVPLPTELEILTSRVGKGSYELRVGENVLSRGSVNTIPPEASYAYIKTGLYRAPIPQPSSIAIRDFSVSVPA